MKRQSLSFSGQVLRTQAFRRILEEIHPSVPSGMRSSPAQAAALSRTRQPLFSQVGGARLSFAERFPRTMIALIAAVHGPGRIGQALYGLLVVLAAGTGAGIAVRQTWLQHNPPTVLDCGPDLAYMLESFPLSQVLPKIFKGEGDCSKVTWSFLGLSIAEWALVWFTLFVLIGLYLLLVRRP